MKIGIIGATGMAGQAIYHEALSRGHETIAFVRNEAKAKELLGNDAAVVVKDAMDLEKSDFADVAVIINAFATSPDKAYLHIDLATRLIAAFRETQNPRLFFILGAGSLQLSDGTLLLEKLRGAPGSESWISIPENALKELEFLYMVNNVNWVGVSPSEVFAPGEKTTPLIGSNRLLVNAENKSFVSDKTMAVAILDEIEHPKVIRERFTVCNQ